jgi:hypothetical protein
MDQPTQELHLGNAPDQPRSRDCRFSGNPVVLPPRPTLPLFGNLLQEPWVVSPVGEGWAEAAE